MISKKILGKIHHRLSIEKGTVYKDPGGKMSVCLVYPNTYHIGMSNLGFLGIYTLLNERTDIVCERAFLPDDDDLEEYARTGSEIVSLESQKPLTRFDIVAFSVSFENDYPHIPTILSLAKIPFRSKNRRDSHPLLILGGMCASFNPEPVADFFDICFIGEGEEMIPDFLSVYRESRSRSDLCERVLKIEGAYVPGLYAIEYRADGGIADRRPITGAPEKVRRRFVSDLSGSSLRTSVVTPETEFSNMYLLEAMRGCPWSCRFCVTGYFSRPPRKKEPDRLKEEVRRALSLTSRVGVISPSLTDYPHAKDILCMDDVQFSITSLRASPRSAELIGFLKGHRSVSIAPEAGTERLRRVVDKRISENEIIETARMILAEGIETLRLYFMIGLPTETDEDRGGIVSLVKEIRDHTERGKIVLTVSTFVPKPFTPFQWHPMERMETIKQTLKTIKKGLQPVKGVTVFHDVPKYAHLQGLLARGDRRMSRLLEGMVDSDDWMSAAASAGIDTDLHLFGQRDLHDILPWDFIDIDVPKEDLWNLYQESLSRP